MVTFKKAKEREATPSFPNELAKYKKELEPKDVMAITKPSAGSGATFKASQEIKKIKLSSADASKEATIFAYARVVPGNGRIDRSPGAGPTLF